MRRYDSHPNVEADRRTTRDLFVAGELERAGLDPGLGHEVAATVEELCLDGTGPFFRLLYGMIDRRLAYGEALPGE